MKRSFFLCAMMVCLLTTNLTFAQPYQLPGIQFSSTNAETKAYKNNAAILLDGKVLTKDHFRENQPKLFQGMTGKLTVASVSNTSGCNSAAINNIRFQVAIKNSRTNTQWIYSSKNLFELDIDHLLRKCEAGDRIIIMPVDQQYSLSLHEMWVGIGC